MVAISTTPRNSPKPDSSIVLLGARVSLKKQKRGCLRSGRVKGFSQK